MFHLMSFDIWNHTLNCFRFSCTLERQNRLKEGWAFVCKCSICTTGATNNLIEHLFSLIETFVQILLLWLHCRPICNMFTIRRGGGCKRDSSRAARADAVRKLTYRSILNMFNVLQTFTWNHMTCVLCSTLSRVSHEIRKSHDVYFILSRSLCDTHPDKIDWEKLWQLQNAVVESVRRSFLSFWRNSYFCKKILMV